MSSGYSFDDVEIYLGSQALPFSAEIQPPARWRTALVAMETGSVNHAKSQHLPMFNTLQEAIDNHPKTKSVVSRPRLDGGADWELNQSDGSVIVYRTAMNGTLYRVADPASLASGGASSSKLNPDGSCTVTFGGGGTCLTASGGGAGAALPSTPVPAVQPESEADRIMRITREMARG